MISLTLEKIQQIVTNTYCGLCWDPQQIDVTLAKGWIPHRPTNMSKDNAGYEEGPSTPSDWAGQPGPIVSQPTSNPGAQPIQMAPIPVGVPPGLEYLTQLDGVMILQQIEPIEILTGWETENRYKIYDKFNRQILYAKEDSNFCSRNCWGPIRQFEMPMKDMSGQEVIRLDRPLACGSCCFPCCLQSLDVLYRDGTLLGKVEQEWTVFIPQYVVKNDRGEKVLRIQGPCITCSCCSDVEFQILALDGKTQVGKISKKWSGAFREVITDADNFGVEFPMDLDVKMKATMIGACMLIDFMYFEHNQNNR